MSPWIGPGRTIATSMTRAGGGSSFRLGSAGEIALARMFGQRLVARPRSCQFSRAVPRFSISRGRSGELHFAIFQSSLGAGGPRGAAVDLEIPPPPERRFGVLLESLQ